MVRLFFLLGLRRASCGAAHNVKFCNFTERRPLSQPKGNATVYRLGNNLELAMQVLLCRNWIYSFQCCDSAFFRSAFSEMQLCTSDTLIFLLKHECCDCTCRMCALEARLIRSIISRRWLLRLSIVYASRAWLTDKLLDEGW